MCAKKAPQVQGESSRLVDGLSLKKSEEKKELRGSRAVTTKVIHRLAFRHFQTHPGKPFNLCLIVHEAIDISGLTYFS